MLGESTLQSVMRAEPTRVALDATVREAEQLMLDRDIRHLPVVDGETLVGLVSDRDIAFASNDSRTNLRDQLHVRDVCSLDFYAVDIGSSLEDVLREMAARRIGSALVTRDGVLVGLLTATDVYRLCADLLSEVKRGSARA